MLRVRPMGVGDLDAAFDLQCRAHSASYHEPRSALASRLKRGPDCCFIAEAGGKLLGYLFAHPWRGSAPVLHHALPVVAEPDHLFLHDLAVAPEARGTGAGRALLAALGTAAAARGLAEMRLVALAGVDDFWLRQGWKPLSGAHLDRSYGAGARPMSRRSEG